MSLFAGAHGAFKRSGTAADALTLRLGCQDCTNETTTPSDDFKSIVQIGKSEGEEALLDVAEALEEVIRAVNNLIERIHHSQFLYALTSTRSIVNGGEYFIPIIALQLSLLFRAIALKQRADRLQLSDAWGDCLHGWILAARKCTALSAAAAALYMLCTGTLMKGASMQRSALDSIAGGCVAWGLLFTAVVAATRAPDAVSARDRVKTGKPLKQLDFENIRLHVAVLSATALVFTPVLILNWALAYAGLLLATIITCLGHALRLACSITSRYVVLLPLSHCISLLRLIVASMLSPLAALALMSAINGECLGQSASSPWQQTAACAWRSLADVPHLNVAVVCCLVPLWATSFL